MALANLLARRLPNLTASQSLELVRSGGVYLGHLRTRRPGARVVVGERVTVYTEALEPTGFDPALLDIVLARPEFVVVQKPPGVPVAATRGRASGTLAEALRRWLVERGVERPYVGVVHRLDRAASGLVLFTTRAGVNDSLHDQFAHHEIDRTYRLQVLGAATERFECDLPLVARPGGRGVRVAQVGEARSKPARTTFTRKTPVHPADGTSLLEARLHTGRTHQIRVHAAAGDLPIVGDGRYGRPAEGEPSELRLHARRLRFVSPVDGETIDVTSRPPAWARASDD